MTEGVLTIQLFLIILYALQMFWYLKSITSDTSYPTKFMFCWESTVHFESTLHAKKPIKYHFKYIRTKYYFLHMWIWSR